MIREHFNADGEPKASYPSKMAAELVAWYYDLETYKCSFCGKWHNGKRKK